MSKLRRNSKGRLEAVLEPVKEEFPGVEIGGRDYQKWSSAVSSTRCVKGLKVGVIPVAFSVSRYLNTTDYFPLESASSDSIRGNSFVYTRRCNRKFNPYRSDFDDEGVSKRH